MRILLYGINFAPEETGIGRYSGELAPWLAARGHQVRVVTGYPYYPGWRIREGFKAWRWSSRQQEGYQLTRCPLWVPKRPRIASRLLHLASFALSSLPALIANMRFRPDVAIVVVPTYACAPNALLYARLTGACAWIHLQDLEVDALLSLAQRGTSERGSGVGRWLLKLESWLLKRFNAVSTISDEMTQRLQQKGVEGQRMTLFPNWIDGSKIFPVADRQAAKAAFALAPERFTAVYAGNIGYKQGLEGVIAAARAMKDDPIHFLICGEGAAKAQLQAEAADLENIRWLGIQPDERFNLLLNAADLHLLPQQAGFSGLVMPSKLPGMMASTIPTLAMVERESAIGRFLDGCGYLAAPEDTAALVATLRTAMADRAQHPALGARARARVLEQLDKEAVLQRFEQALLERVGTAPKPHRHG